MQKCPYCGADSEGRFCSTCGHEIEKLQSALNRDPEMLINKDAARYLFITVSSAQLGFSMGLISECWNIYSDGSYQISAEIHMADCSSKEITRTGRMSEDEFCELCDLVGRTDWSDSYVDADGGTIWFIEIYDTDGNSIHYGDSITVETLDWIVDKLRPLARDIYFELRNAYVKSEMEAEKKRTMVIPKIVIVVNVVIVLSFIAIVIAAQHM